MSFLNAIFFPIVRTGITNIFGVRRYGESLAAIGVVEQISYVAGLPLFQTIYSMTNTLHIKVNGADGFGVHCFAFLTTAICAFIGACSAAGIKSIPQPNNNLQEGIVAVAD